MSGVSVQYNSGKVVDLIEVRKGNVPGHSMVHKFGRNDAVPNGTWEFINLLRFTGWPLSAPTTVRIKAGGDTADTAAGAGAQEITVQGIDSSFNEITETITTAGVSASSVTTASFWRVHRAWVSACGTYGVANTGNIIVENGGGGTDLIKIAVGDGQTHFGGWTVPVGKTAYLLNFYALVDTNKSARIRVYTREDIDVVAAPVQARRSRTDFAVTSEAIFQPKSPSIIILEKSDFWVEALGDGVIVAVTIDFELLVVDN